MEEEYLEDDNPALEEKRTRKTRKTRLPKRLEIDEINALLAAPNRAAITGIRNRCIIELLYRAGLRVGEVCALRPRDINLKKREIYVWDGKGGDRTAGWREGTALDAVLDEWNRRRKKECKPSDYFFCTIQGGPVSTRYVQQMVTRMAKRAGFPPDRVKEITPHKLRHTFATEFLEVGGQIQHLQMLLGHKNVSTTQIYMHVRPEDALEAVHRLGRGKK